MRHLEGVVALLCLVGVAGACSGGNVNRADEWEPGDANETDTVETDTVDADEGIDQNDGRDGPRDGDEDWPLLDTRDVADADGAAGDEGGDGEDGDPVVDGDFSESADADTADDDAGVSDEAGADTCDAAWRPAPPCEPAIPCRWDLGESDCYAACGFANFDPDTGRTICGCPTRDGGKPCTGLPGECEAHCTPPVPFSFPACICDGCPCGYCEFWNPASTCACMGDGMMVCP